MTIVSKLCKSLICITYEITIDCRPLFIEGMYSFLLIMLPILNYFRHILLTSHLSVRCRALGDCYCLSEQPFSRWKIKTTSCGTNHTNPYHKCVRTPTVDGSRDKLSATLSLSERDTTTKATILITATAVKLRT